MKRLADKAVIVGTGLIGASLAAAGKRAGLLGEVVGVGRSAANLSTALSAGYVDSTSTDLVQALARADLVVLAVPVATAVDLLPCVVENTSNACVVTDVGSVKRPICDAAAQSSAASRFVGAHPMAGATDAGSSHADPDLFKDKVTVLTPGTSTDTACAASIEELWKGLGAKVVSMDADAHDRTVAVSSHLPQMVAYCLAETAVRCRDRERLDELIAGGFMKTSELATSDVAMWSSIADLNPAAIVEAMDAFSRGWERLREAIAAGDTETVAAILEQARAMRGSLPK